MHQDCDKFLMASKLARTVLPLMYFSHIEISSCSQWHVCAFSVYNMND